MKKSIELYFAGSHLSNDGWLKCYNYAVDGGDRGGGKFWGNYVEDIKRQLIHIRLTILIPANTEMVNGIIRKDDWTYDAAISIPSVAEQHEGFLQTPYNSVYIIFVY